MSAGPARPEAGERRQEPIRPDEGVKSDAAPHGSGHYCFMTDPRNVAHDKKVQQEKKHHGEEIAPGAIHTPQPGQKPALKHEEPSEKQDPEAAAG